VDEVLVGRPLDRFHDGAAFETLKIKFAGTVFPLIFLNGGILNSENLGIFLSFCLGVDFVFFLCRSAHFFFPFLPSFFFF
jgi:hypothetical protein